MTEIRIIELAVYDDIHSIRDRIATAQSPRVLLVIPWDSPSLRKAVDLQIVQRFAEVNDLEVGIVSNEAEIRAAAHEAGLPVFRSVDAAQRKLQWHLRPNGSEDELKSWTPSARKKRGAQRAAVERDQADVQARRRHPAWIAVKIGIFVAVLSVLFFAALAVIPSAKITLVPQSTQINATVHVHADVNAAEVDPLTGAVPAAEVTTIVRDTQTVPTTGQKSLPDTRAKGQVIFVNQLNTPVRVSQGTVVRTSATSQAIRFVLTQDVEVPAGIGAQADGTVEAVEPGVAGNVPANYINEIEGVAGLAARVSNPDALSSGGDKEVRSVDSADRDAAQEQIKPKLRESALKQLQAQLEPGEFIIPESLNGTILESTFDHEVTEQADQLTLLMRVQYTAQKVKSEDANSLVFGALKSQTPPGYQLIPEGLAFQRGEATAVANKESIFQFAMQGTGYAAANLEVGQAVHQVAGKSIAAARELLQKSLLLKKAPEIKIFPSWFPALPWLSFRIQAEVNPQG